MRRLIYIEGMRHKSGRETQCLLQAFAVSWQAVQRDIVSHPYAAPYELLQCIGACLARMSGYRAVRVYLRKLSGSCDREPPWS